MGGGKRRGRTQRKHFRQSRENVWKRSKADGDSAWEPFATQNPAFDNYYKEQGIVSTEEWDTFMHVLRKPLPAAFRINSSSQFCADIRLQLENDFMKSLQAEVNEGGEVEPIRPLPWYPDNIAWHSNFSRMQLRKNQTLERFHEFLKLENEIGNITRQEAVSMVPPLFLDVHPDHFVLDMCAAPGSKTFQLLEIMHQSSTPGTLPCGMVVANDVDIQRCNLLIHQTKRMCTANLMVTNNEAQHFPGCRSNKCCSDASVMGSEKGPGISQLLFDRVLCDVPCSGDGTLRKAPDIWRKWNVGMGNGLHNLQVLVAMRGVSLLKVGGRMVYSTCSMNPVEDEAVVAEVLRRCGDSLELVDVSSELIQLIRRPGLNKWKVCDKGSWLSSYKDVPKSRRSVIAPSMFPSGRSYMAQADNEHGIDLAETHENGDENLKSHDDIQPVEDPATSADVSDMEVSSFPLERCIRILPHDQNGGAFFIAVFHKLSDVPGIPEKPQSRQEHLSSRNDKPCENLSYDIVEDAVELETNTEEDAVELEANTENDTEEKYVAASDADLLANDPEEAALENDPSLEFDDDKPEEAHVPGNEEPAPKRVGGKRKLQNQGKWKGIDPVVFFEDETVINSIKAFYGIDESFPFKGHLVTRNSDTSHVKRIYYISKSVKDVLELNFSVGQQLKITSIGMKMFERQTSKEGTSSPCAFRISSEGLPLILPFITKQILFVSLVDFKHLLQYKTIKFADFVDAEFGEKASKLMLGCCVVVLSKGSQASTEPIKVDASTIAIGCWKGRGSISVMVTAVDCQELLERLVVRMETENGSVVQENGVPSIEVDEMEKHK
ncbi:uncharacterized protein LOC131159581 [Malania oleifera]|uniref:uncharacterized protein LOC131159581 n=1 Tax=Malania oleifera TaxID=397392 RepID=UPI0025AE0E0D|nr:uncharacterized protein LOC131159581 [Malania oleifera]